MQNVSKVAEKPKILKSKVIITIVTLTCVHNSGKVAMGMKAKLTSLMISSSYLMRSLQVNGPLCVSVCKSVI